MEEPAKQSSQGRNETSLTLLDHIRQGDEAAWQRLVFLYTPLVCHWCQRWGLQPSDVDDMVQEVFTTVSKSIGDFRRDREGDTFRGWLRGITRNRLLGFSRHRGSRASALGGTAAMQQLQQVPDMEAKDDEPEDKVEISALFHRALEMIRSEFEPHTWQAFWKVTVDGRVASHVAEELGMTPTAVRMAKYRILRRLRAELGDRVD